jgi:1-pyrroline-5-carboxylate dehydrogenase
MTYRRERGKLQRFSPFARPPAWLLESSTKCVQRVASEVELARKDHLVEPYRTEPYSDFTASGPRAAYEHALDTVAGALGDHVPLVIGGEPVQTGDQIVSVDPSEPSVVVGTAAAASPVEAEQALDAATTAFPGWAAQPAETRAALVHRIGDIMAERKYELAAWETREAGKNWAEAEADVAEAIDFCHYYAHEALRVAEPVPVHGYPGESNESFLMPLGVGVVIPPWNFPLAILAGMTVGPVAAGNTVVLKPASNTPLLGSRFMEVVAAAGLPPGVVNFLPGPGSGVGNFLVEHPRTRFVNFTGSKEVGLGIAAKSALIAPGQVWLKRAYMEMGGKDGLIVDATADLDAAAEAIVKSAYGFQGQKCSACSRVIAVNAIHDDLLDRVVAKAAALRVGPAAENHPVGPVISAEQHRMILDEIARGRDEAKLVVGGRAVDRDGGFFIEPTIFTEVAPRARLAQHEIFGPVLSFIRADDFGHAIEIGNDTEYGLTGGLFSSDEEHIARARAEFHVGNLYINRKITGALVGIQPFGGFKMSGSNAKAGGPDYLRLFVEMKTVARKLD